MDSESLRCFVATADTLHFRRAAERVFLSPAALSERIRSLEDTVGTPLFERTTRRVRLTDAGQRLLPRARRLLEELDHLGAVAKGSGEALPFALTLGTRYELGLSWLVPALDELRARRPERTLHLAMGDTDALVERLERGVIDAAVLSTRRPRPLLRSTPLHAESYAFVSADTGPRSPKEAVHFTLVDVSADLPLFHYLLDAWPEGQAWRFRDHLYLGGIAAIRQRILAGGGVGVLPRYFIEADLAAGRLVELVDRPLRADQFRLIWREGHPREAELEALATDLRARPLG